MNNGMMNLPCARGVQSIRQLAGSPDLRIVTFFRLPNLRHPSLVIRQTQKLEIIPTSA
jgi:hypothetical protein